MTCSTDRCTLWVGGTVISLRPARLAEANAYVSAHHSHHRAVRGHLFSVAATVGDEIVGIVIVGRPVAAGFSDPRTMEVTRLCTDGYRNAASRLLGAAWAAAKAMGVTRMVSYTRADEGGVCYRAAGWVPCATVKGRSWNTGNKSMRWLPGFYEPTTEIIDRVRWEICTARRGPDGMIGRKDHE